MKIKWKKVIPISLGLIILLFGGTLFYFRNRLDASLPELEGRVEVAGLSDDLKIIRDARGLVRIEAQSLADLFLAQGFIHAQDRFFQMDLLRRAPGGELAEILGPWGVPTDREMRKLGRRQVAQAMLAALPEAQRAHFENYAQGVNQGLAALGEKPPEYFIIAGEPQPWLAEDCLMVGMYFFEALSLNRHYEIQVGRMESLLPAALVDFLTPEWMTGDVTLTGPEALPERPPIPGPEVFRVTMTADAVDRDFVRTFDDVAIGSNNWAVAKERSKKAMAILANDPHLDLRSPNIWYRNELSWPGGEAMGVTAPGVPGVIIGANTHLAWGLTNGMADHDDLVIVEVDPENSERYRVPQGFEDFGERQERILVGGEEAEEFVVRTTRWGPVVAAMADGRPLALRSTGLAPETHDFDLLQMMFQTEIEAALDLGSRWYGPSQNLLVADVNGRIGWVLTGFLPQRRGFDGKAPRSWADGSCGWSGSLDEALRPRLLDPESGILFTANNRCVGLEQAQQLSRIWVPSWRAQRIAELLNAEAKFNEADLMAIQLDTRNAQYDRYRDLALRLFPDAVEDKALKVALAELRAWDGHAHLDSHGLHILKYFAQRLRQAFIAPIVAPCAVADEHFVYNWPMVDEVVFRLLTEQPAHLLAPEATSFDEVAREVLKQLVSDLDRNAALAVDLVWGKVMQPTIKHPVLGDLSPFKNFVNLPAQPLPGDANTVRAQTSRSGASMRMVVAPADLKAAILQSPGGQSGHFRSPHYSDLHQAWVDGSPDPMRLGAAFKTLKLTPKR